MDFEQNFQNEYSSVKRSFSDDCTSAAITRGKLRSFEGGTQVIVRSTSQHSATWRSDRNSACENIAVGGGARAEQGIEWGKIRLEQYRRYSMHAWVDLAYHFVFSPRMSFWDVLA